MKLILVRHGEPDYDADCLTELGKKQAKAAAERLKGENIDEIYASPLGRARETASYLAGELGKPIHICDFMREIWWCAKNEGEEIPFNGHPWMISRQIAADGGDLLDVKWADGKYFNKSIVGERVRNVQTGIDAFLEELGFRHEYPYFSCVKPNGKTIALFSHAGSSTAALAHILNLPFPYLCVTYDPLFTAITVLEFDESGKKFLPRVLLMNDSRHIETCEII